MSERLVAGARRGAYDQSVGPWVPSINAFSDADDDGGKEGDVEGGGGIGGGETKRRRRRPLVHCSDGAGVVGTVCATVALHLRLMSVVVDYGDLLLQKKRMNPLNKGNKGNKRHTGGEVNEEEEVDVDRMLRQVGGSVESIGLCFT